MVTVSPDTLPFKNLGEAQVLRHLVFGDDVVGTFGLAHDKFADLKENVSKWSSSACLKFSILT